MLISIVPIFQRFRTRWYVRNRYWPTWMGYLETCSLYTRSRQIKSKISLIFVNVPLGQTLTEEYGYDFAKASSHQKLPPLYCFICILLGEVRPENWRLRAYQRPHKIKYCLQHRSNVPLGQILPEDCMFRAQQTPDQIKNFLQDRSYATLGQILPEDFKFWA